MQEERLTILLKKVLAGDASEVERREVELWYQSKNDEEIVWEMESRDEAKEIQHRMWSALQHHMQTEQKRSHFSRFSKTWKIAATMGVGIALALLLFKERQQPSAEHRLTGVVNLKAGYSSNKYLLLPDSSRVILHPGSKITYNFSGKERSVQLIGEAFFDVRHLTERPFVIHSGAVTTTVLGTAFSISAYPGKQVAVTVTRGKVSVCRNDKKYMVLYPDQQAKFDEAKQELVNQTVDSKTEINWVKADMQFDELPFTQLAEKLNKRYDIVIDFKNPVLGSCPITGRFTGQESLKEVLDLITSTTGTTYIITDRNVTINGKGCQ